jgi:hypothetical protein
MPIFSAHQAQGRLRICVVHNTFACGGDPNHIDKPSFMIIRMGNLPSGRVQNRDAITPIAHQSDWNFCHDIAVWGHANNRAVRKAGIGDQNDCGDHQSEHRLNQDLGHHVSISVFHLSGK